MGSNRSAAKRLIKELTTWNNIESKEEKGVERLGPINDDELLVWEAVINGKGVGGGYDGMCYISISFLFVLLSFPFVISLPFPILYIYIFPLPSPLLSSPPLSSVSPPLHSKHPR